MSQTFVLSRGRDDCWTGNRVDTSGISDPLRFLRRHLQPGVVAASGLLSERRPNELQFRMRIVCHAGTLPANGSTCPPRDSKALQVPPSTLLGKAVAYALNEWEKLLRYLDSPYLSPDTNSVENSIRPFVIGRRNWLFSGSPRGAHASATLYSMIETAKAAGLEPYRYLRYVFTRLPVVRTENDYRALTPHHLDRNEFVRLSL